MLRYCTLFFKEIPDDSLYESKHVAMCDMTLKCCVGRLIFVYLFMIVKNTSRCIRIKNVIHTVFPLQKWLHSVRRTTFSVSAVALVSF